MFLIFQFWMPDLAIDSISSLDCNQIQPLAKHYSREILVFFSILHHQSPRFNFLGRGLKF